MTLDRVRLNPRIAALTLVSFAFGSGSFVFVGILERMAVELGVSTAAAGQLQTAYVLTGALFGPVVAWALSRVDRRILVMSALAAALVLHLICAMVSSYELLLVLRALSGLAGSVAMPGATVSAAALAPPERRGSALAMVSAGVTLAFVVGVPIGSVVGATFGWRATFVFAAGLSGAALAVVALFMPSVTPPANRERGEIRLRAVWPIYMTTFLYFAANMTISLYIAPLVRVAVGVTGAGVGAFQFLIGVSSIGGLWLGARAADRGVCKSWIVQGFTIQALAMLLHLAAIHRLAPAGWPSLLLVCSAFFAGATALFSMSPVTQSRLVAETGGAPVAMSINASVLSFGQAGGAAAGGAALAMFGAPAIPAVALAISLFAIVAVSLAYQRDGYAVTEDVKAPRAQP